MSPSNGLVRLTAILTMGLSPFAGTAMGQTVLNESPAAVAISPAECTSSGFGDGVCSSSCWTVRAGTVILHRSKASPTTLVEDGQTGAELVNVSDFDLGFAAGPQFEITRHLSTDWDLGVEYFNVDGWEARRSLADPGNLRVPFISDDPDDYFDTASARLCVAALQHRSQSQAACHGAAAACGRFPLGGTP